MTMKGTPLFLRERMRQTFPSLPVVAKSKKYCVCPSEFFACSLSQNCFVFSAEASLSMMLVDIKMCRCLLVFIGLIYGIIAAKNVLKNKIKFEFTVISGGTRCSYPVKHTLSLQL